MRLLDNIVLPGDNEKEAARLFSLLLDSTPDNRRLFLAPPSGVPDYGYESGRVWKCTSSPPIADPKTHIQKCKNTLLFNHKIGTTAKLEPHLAWSRGFNPSNGTLRNKKSTGDNHFRKSPGHVFSVTFWDLLTELLIDSMWLRKGFLWNFWGFSGLSSLRWFQKSIFNPGAIRISLCCNQIFEHIDSQARVLNYCF